MRRIVGEVRGSRPGTQSPGFERSAGKRVVTASERRRVVTELQAAAGISGRPAVRFTRFPRSTMRYRPVREPQKHSRSVFGRLRRSRRARTTIATWRHDYNHVRPHSSLDARTRAEFLAAFTEERMTVPQPGGVH